MTAEACARCGRLKADAPALEALAWVRETGPDGERWLCDRCARDHVRDIEAKLPDDYW